MTTADTTIAVAVVVLFLFSIVLAVAEPALTRVSRARAQALAETNGRKGEVLLSLVEHQEWLNPTLLLVLSTQLVQSTLLGVRATSEGFSTTAIGVVMSCYYAGFLFGTTVAPHMIRHVGHVRSFAAFAAVAAAATLCQAVLVHPVAALLTILGYSVNDTIVIFDRARENLKTKKKDPLSKILNDSLNQTLTRTLISNGTTFLAVLGLYLFGGEVLRGFGFTMVIGILVGTYSTIYIASPIVIWWQNRQAGRVPSA